MFKVRAVLLACVWWIVAAGTAAAQDDRSVGLVMGAPLHVGVLWQPADRIAVRPVLSWQWSSSEIGSASLGGVSLESSTSIGRINAGVGLLFFLSDDEGLRTYLAPTYLFGRSEATSDDRFTLPDLPLLPGFPTTGVLPAISETRQSTVTSHEGRILLGADYRLGSRFGVFGEFGLAFSSASSSSSGIDGVESSGRSAGTTASVGVVVMF